MDQIATRVCSICKNEFPLTTEYWHRMGAGFQPRCKPCACAGARKWYADNPERVAINHSNSSGKRTAVRAEKRQIKEAAYVEPTHRICNVCQQGFPLTPEFWNRSKGGLTYPCKSCAKKRAADWYRANTERASAQRAEYREANHEAILATKARYRKENPEKIQAQLRASYERNREHRIAYSAQWRVDNPEKAADSRKREYENGKDRIKQRAKDWAQANPDLVKIRTARRRAAFKNAPGKFTKADLLRQFEKQEGNCFYCHQDLAGKSSIDHYIPLSKGGSNWPDNIVLACWPCNNAKRAKLPSEFKPQ